MGALNRSGSAQGAGQCVGDDTALTQANLAFHRKIGVASGNALLARVLEVLSIPFEEDRRTILKIYGNREKDRAEHLAILTAIRAGDEATGLGAHEST